MYKKRRGLGFVETKDTTSLVQARKTMNYKEIEVKSDKFPAKEKRSKLKRPKQKKRKRLIIRNLSFKAEEDTLTEVFSKFGKVVDVKIPLKTDGKKRGFGFVEYEDTKSLIQAMKTMNYKEIEGRKVAIDFAVDKTNYQLKLQNLRQDGEDYPHVKKYDSEEHDSTAPKIKSEKESDSESGDDNKDDPEESEEEDEDEKRLNAFLKEFDSGAESLTKPAVKEDAEESSSESSSEESDEEGEDSEANDKKNVKKEFGNKISHSPSKKPEWKKRDSQDVSEKKTVFLRNVSFASSQESLSDAMEEYGEIEYCVLCMDHLTDHPKGTAFIKFKEKSSADKLINQSFGEPGVVVDGRKLLCAYAISREDVGNMAEASKKPKDKRNLNLLRVGLIMPNSKESEGVSESDMTKRYQLELMKKQKLKNVNYFVSDKRLMIHNLPKNFSDQQLRELFKKTVGKDGAITEARIMKELGKTDAQGRAVSKGFGFITVSTHEGALKALNELNNNPKTFIAQKRPIVEFSVENKMALLSQERRREKFQLLNKRRAEEIEERQRKEASAGNKKGPNAPYKNTKRKNMKNMPPAHKKMKQDTMNNAENSVDRNNTQNTKHGNQNRKNSFPDNKKRNQNIMNNQKNVVEGNSQITKQKNKKWRQNRVKKPQNSVGSNSQNTNQVKKRKQLPRKKGQKNVDKSSQQMSNLINKYKDKLMNKIT